MINHPIYRILINAIWFKICWISCVYFGNLAVLAVIPATIAIHTRFVSLSAAQWQFTGVVTLAGVCFDTILSVSGVIVFADHGVLPPLWLSTIWFVFATLLVVSLPALITNPILFTGLSGIGGVISYTAGTAISSADLGISLISAVVSLCIGWMAIGFILHKLYLTMVSDQELLNAQA